MGHLHEIIASKRREMDALPPFEASESDSAKRPPLPVPEALARGAERTLKLIAEIKWKSPSAGPLSRALSTEARGLAYASAQVSMVSMLCDGPFFDGGYGELAKVRRAYDEAGIRLPLLAKEFVIDARQIGLATRAGADAILLIARCVSPSELRELAARAFDAGIEPFVEVTKVAELEAALLAKARVVGVNARDLDTLVIDKANAAAVLAAIPANVVRVHLSGLRSAADVRDVANGPADAALIGEALMRQDDPRPLLRDMVAATRA